LNSGEECDDGNLVGGDGCDADCLFERIPLAQCGTTQAPGFGVGGFNVFAFSLSEPDSIHLETMGELGCPGDTVMELRDAGGVLLVEDDDGGTVVPCSLIEIDLPASTYTVVVRGFLGAALPPYLLSYSNDSSCASTLGRHANFASSNGERRAGAGLFINGDLGFGSAVAIGDTFVVVGNPKENGGVNTARLVDGGAYQEIESAFLDQPPGLQGCGGTPPNEFGFSVDILADEYLVVGVPLEYGETCDFEFESCPNFDISCCTPYGEVWGFEWRDAEQDWGAFELPTEKILPPEADRFTGLRFGHAVALSGDLLVVGAPGDDGRNDGGPVVPDRGSVFVYRRVTAMGVSTWQFVQKLLPPSASGLNFGHDVDLAADGSIIVGALPLPGQDNGTVSIFRAIPSANGTAFSSIAFPKIAALADGGFVVTWQDNVDATRANDAFAQRFDADGNAVGFESLLSVERKGAQQSVGAAPVGEGFSAVWTAFGFSGDGSDSGISARRFGSVVNPIDGEFQVNSYTTGTQRQPAIASLANGRIAVAWAGEGDGEGAGGGGGIFARAFDGDAPVADPERVNDFTSGAQTQPSLALHGDGFVIAWQSTGEDGSGEGVFARRLDASAGPAGTPFQVNETTASSQQDPDIARSADDGFIVVWESGGGQDGDASGVFARRYGPDATPVTGEFQVNVATSDDQDDPVVAVGETGSFLVAWESSGQDGDLDGIFVRRFSSSGVAGAEFRANVETDGDQQEPEIVALAGGDFVVIWESVGANGIEVIGRRFSADGTPLGGEFRIDNVFATWEIAREFTSADVPAGTVGLGATVAIASGEAVFGAPGDGVSCGDAFAIEFHAGAWTNPQDLTEVWDEAADPDPFECVGFGGSVSIDESLVLVGAAGPAGGDDLQGRVYPFRRTLLGASSNAMTSGEAEPVTTDARLPKPGSPSDVYGSKDNTCEPGCYAEKVRSGRNGRIVVTCPCGGDDGNDGNVQPDINENLLCGDGVVNSSVGEQCDDGNLASGDCCAGDCKFEAADAPCTDGIDCTADECDGLGACVSIPDDEACSDGDVCNGGETCDAEKDCQSGVPLTCDDDVFCNGEETCDPVGGCESGTAPCPSNAACVEDGDTCEPCGQPVSNGSNPVATDCLYILRTAVGLLTCDPTCICNLDASIGNPNATDALVCLNAAVGVTGLLNCNCPTE